MKTKLHCLLLIILNTNLVFSQEDWVRDSSFIGVKNLTDIQFINENVGFTTGQGVLKTIDGGITWKKKSDLNTIAIHIIDSLNIWAVGGDNYTNTKGLILHSTDGGENWNTIDGVIPNSYFYDVIFITPDIGFIVGEQKGLNPPLGLSLSTIDGGQTWTQNTLPINLTNFGNGYSGLKKIYFYNNHGWIVGRGKLILHSDDSGQTWTIQNYSWSDSFEYMDLESIFFVNENKGYAVGRNSFLSTSDGGNNWSDIESSEYYTSIYFLNEQEGFLTNGESYSHTTDGGETWVEENVSIYLTNIYFFNNQIGWITGNSSTLLSTVDAGNTWDISNMELADKFNDLFLIDEQYGWIVGNAGKIFSTQDSSETWISIESHTASDLYKVLFINHSVGWSIGECGLLINSIDGGLSWSPIAFTNKNLTSLFFVNEQTGWIGGENVIFKTTDGGSTWDSTQVNFTVQDMYFLNEDNGFVIGSGSTIAHTGDGGANWTSINHNYKLYLNSIHFSDKSHGWICGNTVLYDHIGGPHEHAVILSTSDAGNTWTLDTFKDYDGLNDIFFIDENIGYAISEWPKGILKTINGGQSWAGNTLDPVNYMNSIYFTNSENGFIVGSTGWINNKFEPFMLLKTKNGGGDFPWNAEKILTDSVTIKILKPGQNDMIIYPNPTSKDIYINTKLNINEISIIDVSGKIIKTITTDLKVINVGDLVNGVYFLKITTGQITLTKKFIKQ